MQTPWIFWVIFNAFVIIMLALDLGVWNRKAHVISFKEAIRWTVVWVSLALLFNAGIYFVAGHEKAVEFLTGYVIEKSLSIDNIFVIALIFSWFGIPDKHQHKVLFWGIIGALFMRAAFIFAGIALMEKFHAMIYVFGVTLLIAAYKTLTRSEKKRSPQKNRVTRLFRRFFPVTENLHNGKFFVRVSGKKMATPMFLVLLVVETTDILFAVDSIPAILAITQDRFIVYTSNVFALLGLRSLYFAFAGMMHRFIYLSKGLGLILFFVGVKLLIQDFYALPAGVALLVIVTILAASVWLSLRYKRVTKSQAIVR